MGDEDFIPIPWEGLLSKDYARERRKLIDAAKASLTFRPGVAEKFMQGMEPIERPIDIKYSSDSSGEGDTSYLCVIDKDRNVVSFTPSLHTAFGTNVVMGNLGFSFNCRGDYFSLTAGHANALAPGKRPRSTLQSTLVLKDGKPFMVLGSPGGDDQCMRTHADVPERGGVRDERAAGDRGAALVDAQFPAVALSARDVSGRLDGGGSDSAARAGCAQAEGTQAEGGGPMVAGAECGHRGGSRDECAERRGGSALRRLRAGVVSRGIRAVDGLGSGVGAGHARI